MNTSAEPPGITGLYHFLRWQPAAYWLTTAAVVAELGVGGIWDITRIPSVRELVTPGAPPTAATRPTPGITQAIPVPGHAGETGTGAPAPRKVR